MKKISTLLLTLGMFSFCFGQNLVITGVFDGPLSGGTPKVVELTAINNIADLSIYGLGSANNGGGSDGIEFTFPAVAATAGQCITVAGDSANFFTYFNVYPDYISGSATGVNGDDAVELFENMTVIDVFGDINVDGSGTAWDYLDGWVYRVSGTGPDGSTFVPGNWTYSGVDANDGQTSNSTATTPFPKCSYVGVVSTMPTINFAASTYSFNESVGTATVDVTLTNPDPVNAITVSLNLNAASTATFGSDFTTTALSLTFPAGTTGPQVITATIIDDTMIEPDETIIVDLINPTNGAVIGNVGTTTITIVDNDTPTIPTVDFVAASTNVLEDVGTITIDLAIVDPNSSPTSVDVAIGAASTASAPDYVFSAPTTVTFPGSSAADQSITVDIVDDALIEGAEVLILELTNPTNGALIGMDTIYTINIGDNDFPVTPVNLMITGVFDGPLSGGTPKAVELYAFNAIPDLSIYGLGTANNGGGTDGIEFTFPAISVAAGECMVVSGDSANYNAFFGAFPDFISGAATGVNGDDAVELFQYLTVVDVFGDINMDGSGTAWDYLDGWVYRVGGTGPDGTVFNQSNWTYSGIDVMDGQTDNATATVPFPTCTYMPPVSNVPTIQFASATSSFNEGDGTIMIDVNILNPDMMNATSISLNLNGASTATFGSDYTTSSATLTFPAGSSAPQQISAMIIDDAIVEGDETIIIELINPTNGAVIGNISTSTVTIVDNDVAPDPEVMFATTSTIVAEDAGTIMVDLGITNENANPTTVDVAVVSSSTAMAADYVIANATVTFPGGSSAVQSVSIDIVDDMLLESTEDLVLELTNPTNGATIGANAMHTVSITDNDVSSNLTINLADQIEVFPNPASALLNVNSTIQIERMTINNVLGQTVVSLENLNASEQLNISGLVEGIYLVSFKTAAGSWTKQFIKK